jgi:hypothetical protein
VLQLPRELQQGDSCSAASWLAYDSAANGWSAWLLRWAVLKDVGDGLLEVVLRGAGALLSNLEVAIVDAAVIDGAKSFRACALGNKDCRLRRDCSVSKGNELVMRVEQDICFSAIGGFVLTYSFRSFSDVGIDEPKYYVPGGEFVFDAP